MEQARLIRSGFLFSTFAALTGISAFQQPPGETIVRSLLDDLSPSLIQEAMDHDFRANDRDWCHVDDFWTVNVGLYNPSVDPDASIKLIELSVASADQEDP